MEVPIGTALSIFALAFAAWAWVVAWGIKVMAAKISEIKDDLKDVADAQITHINQTERRLTMLETEFRYLRDPHD